ncbi:MAG TPA: MoaD/ThiS family protein [Mycobacteriales bacterium]|jgi:molybdopterin synthase sulfur carrier subunit|nr:MoaD/ThiS family protein [Mycobacteriales bacterium]
MAVSIRIPTPMRNLTGGAAEVSVEAATLSEAIKALDVAHPGVAERVLDESGALRRFVNVYVGDEDVRFLDGLQTELSDGTSISIIPAVAGG